MDVSAYGMSTTMLARQVMRQARLTSQAAQVQQKRALAVAGGQQAAAVGREGLTLTPVSSQAVTGPSERGPQGPGSSLSALAGGRSAGKVNGVVSPDGLGAAGTVKDGPSFADIMNRFIEQDNQARKEVDGFARGEHNRLHETMIALTKADLNLTMMMTVRNKLLDAYQQVMRMS